jgi:hypothetical protein
LRFSACGFDRRFDLAKYTVGKIEDGAAGLRRDFRNRESSYNCHALDPACRDYVARATARPAFKKAYADQMAHFSAAD